MKLTGIMSDDHSIRPPRITAIFSQLADSVGIACEPLVVLPDRPFSSIEDHHRERLESFRVMWHSEVGVFAAAFYCAAHKLALPDWLVPRLPVVLSALLTGPTGKRGRANNPIARYRQDLIDYARWDAVKEVRYKQTELLEEVNELKAMRTVPTAMLKERTKLLAWVGESLEQAYLCAAALLAGGRASGGYDAVRKSYRRVERNSRDPGQLLRYHLVDPQVLRELGIDPFFDQPRGRKIVPLYDLTLD